MGEIIDISLPLRPSIPIWPDSVGFRLTPTMRLEADEEYNVSRLDCDLHVGTHVDAPWHCVENGTTVDRLPLDILIGPAVVACLPEAEAITVPHLLSLDLPSGTERLLLRTRNSELWAAGVTQFTEDYVALTADAAEWVASRGIRLIGIDYLSIQRYDDSALTHRILLAADVVVLEGLNLAGVKPGSYELICLPLKIEGAEGAPVRAVLRQRSSSCDKASDSGGSL